MFLAAATNFTTAGAHVVSTNSCQPAIGSRCSISSLEVYCGRDKPMEISYQGFTLSTRGTIQVKSGSLTSQSWVEHTTQFSYQYGMKRPCPLITKGYNYIIMCLKYACHAILSGWCLFNDVSVHSPVECTALFCVMLL